MHSSAAAAVWRSPVFTASQWVELEHQALIYKYLMAGVPVPADLLLPIRRRFFHFSSCICKEEKLRLMSVVSSQKLRAVGKAMSWTVHGAPFLRSYPLLHHPNRRTVYCRAVTLIFNLHKMLGSSIPSLGVSLAHQRH